MVRLEEERMYPRYFTDLEWNFTFLCFGIKTSLTETLEYFFYMPVMLGHVIIRVDEYIIQINHNTDIQKVRENAIHELLEGCGSIGKAKGYYRPFK